MTNKTRIENCNIPDMRLAAPRRKDRRKPCRAKQLRSRQSMPHPLKKNRQQYATYPPPPRGKGTVIME
jgi:hypothetical protein